MGIYLVRYQKYRILEGFLFTFSDGPTKNLPTTPATYRFTVTLLYYILLASGLKATTYGYAESYCGPIGKPRPCIKGAPMANGEPFDPDSPTVAIAAPSNLRIPLDTYVWLRIKDGPCVRLKLTDKMNPRYIGVRSFDLTPKSVELLTGKPATRHWSDVVYVCQKARKYESSFRRLNHHPLIDVRIWSHFQGRPAKPQHNQLKRYRKSLFGTGTYYTNP